MNSKGYTLAALLGLSALSMPAAVGRLPKTNLYTHDINAVITNGVVTTPGVGCRGCHAPHSGSLLNGGTQGTGAILLWARSFPAPSTFGVYDSATMTSVRTDLGLSALSLSTDARMYSLLCLSCHDGVTSSAAFPNMKVENKVGWRGATGSLGLTNDHPVNMLHDANANPSLVAATTVTNTLPLYGGTVQCGTCHEPHNNTNTKFLRQPNNSAACTTCHL